MLFWTITSYFYSHFFKKKLQANKKVKHLHINTHIGPFCIQLRLQDLSILYEIFFLKTYTIPKEEVSSGDVLDLGAHIGLASIFFWDGYFPNSHFYCIEPSEENVKLLEYNTRILNRTIIIKAVSNYDGFGYLNTNTFGHNCFLTKEQFSNKKIEVCTIDMILKEFRITEVSLCKIDIEGEEEILLCEHANWTTITKLFVIEVHKKHNKTEFNSFNNGRIRRILSLHENTIDQGVFLFSNQ